MRKLFATTVLIFLVHSVVLSQTTWKAPGYQPETIRKVMVLAKVTDVAARQQLEDYTVKLLSDKGIQAVPAYSYLKKTRFATREEFLAYADSIQVDALLSYTVESAEQLAQESPTVSVGVGVGMYGGYVGASAPIAGGVKVVTMIGMTAKFYTRSHTGEQWFIQLSGKLDGPTDKLAYSFAKTASKAMLKEGLFLPAK